jgi:hypothetical protein
MPLTTRTGSPHGGSSSAREVPLSLGGPGVVHPDQMRIESEAGTPVAQVYLWLTVAEASELRDALDDMLRADPDAGWHAHVSSEDYGAEVPVAWDVPTARISAARGRPDDRHS